MIYKMFTSSIGRKLIVGLTGACLLLFCVIHALGNLQLFAGQDTINHYAEMLKSMPLLLWAFRLGLLTVFVVHVVFAVGLTVENYLARPEKYLSPAHVKAALSSRYMILSGSIILLYVVGHLLHFTIGVILPDNFTLTDVEGRPDVYSMVVNAFSLKECSLLYILAMIALWSHLNHGVASLFQTFTLRCQPCAKGIDIFGTLVATVVFIAFISIPLSIMFGFIR